MSDVEREQLFNYFENIEYMDGNCKSQKTEYASSFRDNNTKADGHCDNNIIVNVNTNCELEEEYYSLNKDGRSDTSECSNDIERSDDFDIQTTSIQSNSYYIGNDDGGTRSTKSIADSKSEEIESYTQTTNQGLLNVVMQLV